VVAYVPKATVQAAIGAVPLAAGVSSGDVILAVAVLSILITAPLGAIGIMILGEKVLDHGAYSSYRFKDLRINLALPHVGSRLRNRQSNTVWKVIEEKEIWQEKPDHGDGPMQAENPFPVICLRLWLEDKKAEPGTGKTITRYYSMTSSSFQGEWEMIYDF